MFTPWTHSHSHCRKSMFRKNPSCEPCQPQGMQHGLPLLTICYRIHSKVLVSRETRRSKLFQKVPWAEMLLPKSSRNIFQSISALLSDLQGSTQGIFSHLSVKCSTAAMASQVLSSFSSRAVSSVSTSQKGYLCALGRWAGHLQAMSRIGMQPPAAWEDRENSFKMYLLVTAEKESMFSSLPLDSPYCLDLCPFCARWGTAWTGTAGKGTQLQIE